MFGGVIQKAATGFVLRTMSLSANGRPIAPDPHSVIHDGRMFSIDTTKPGLNFEVPANGTFDLLIVAGENNWPHFEFAYRFGALGTLVVYEFEPDHIPTGGEDIPAENKKWDSPQEFKGYARRWIHTQGEKTAFVNNAIWKEGCIILGSDHPQRPVGSPGEFSDELIVPEHHGLLIRLENRTSSTPDACICGRVYNAPKIES